MGRNKTNRLRPVDKAMLKSLVKKAQRLNAQNPSTGDVAPIAKAKDGLSEVGASVELGKPAGYVLRIWETNDSGNFERVNVGGVNQVEKRVVSAARRWGSQERAPKRGNAGPKG